MKFLLAIILTLVFSYCLRKSIKKHAKFYYIGALAIALFTVFVDTRSLPSVVADVMSTFFQYGTVSTAMFSLVMYMNAFKNGSKIQKTFMPIRAELSIIACILTYGHNFYSGKTYVALIFTNFDKMSSSTILALIMTCILLFMMTPLFITSFKSVRKKMKPKKWKKLQRLSYAFYMLIYVHIMILMIPAAFAGSLTYIINVAVYSIVFLTYATLRLLKYYKKSKNKIAIALIAAMYLIFASVMCYNLIDINFQSQKDSIEIEESQVQELEESGEVDEIEEVSKYDIDLSEIPDGTYIGEGEGFHGTIIVSVTMLSGVIESITVDSHVDDESYMSSATWVRKYIMQEQTIDVDAISGATFSSNGIKDAVLDALTIEESE